MEPTVMFTLLIIITVSASLHPLEAVDTTTLSPSNPNRIIYTLPAAETANNNNSNIPIKPKADESRLEITLKMDENDKEVIDNDMGKYLRWKELKKLICKKGLHSHSLWSCVGVV